MDCCVKYDEFGMYCLTAEQLAEISAAGSYSVYVGDPTRPGTWAFLLWKQGELPGPASIFVMAAVTGNPTANVVSVTANGNQANVYCHIQSPGTNALCTQNPYCGVNIPC